MTESVRTSPVAALDRHHTRTSCRGCGGEDLRRFLTLGPTPLANAFLASPDAFTVERSYPLDVYFCPGCTLVQLADVVDPELLFGHYLYVTGTSDTITAHNQRYARGIVDRLQLANDDLIVEVASNNGQLLRCFRDSGVRVLGVEPAVNIAAMAVASGVPTVNRFFDETTAQQIRDSHGPARALVANNVLAHVDDTQGFLRACTLLVAPDGLVIIEVPYLGDLLDHLEFDTVYHEHLCYFSISSLMHLCDATGLSIVDVDRLPVHGGSLRIYAAVTARGAGHAPAVRALAAQEGERGFDKFQTYASFAARVCDTREQLRALLGGLVQAGHSIAAYGAPAKGNTLLNYCGIDTRLVAYTVDKNPLKVGLYTPGAHLPVLPVSVLLDRQPDYVLILAWNFADEIIAQQAEYHDRGGRFIVPIPHPKIVAA